MQFEKNGLIFFILAIAGMIVLLVVFFILIIIRNYKTNVNRKVEIFKSIIKTQETERMRIGRNLHDELGALLAFVKLNIDSLNHVQTLSEVKDISADTIEKVDQALKETRKIVNDLVPHHLQKFGLIAALESLGKTTHRNEKFSIQFTHDSFPEKRFPISTEIDIYRIIQELMNNSIKHSGGTLVTIDLRLSESNLKIRFTDNGKGFDSSKVKSGIGTDNLRSRVSLYHGDMKLNSEIGKGTDYLITFPLNYLNK